MQYRGIGLGYIGERKREKDAKETKKESLLWQGLPQ
jgi:hypothetical protein